MLPRPRACIKETACSDSPCDWGIAADWVAAVDALTWIVSLGLRLEGFCWLAAGGAAGGVGSVGSVGLSLPEVAKLLPCSMHQEKEGIRTQQ